ncbi:MAG: hypothetical protein IKO20_05115 [Bacteroidaceae bacterium]|nr:hypothetical protein [Bacteroidaceae bacterium]
MMINIDLDELTKLTEQMTPISDIALLLDIPEGDLRDAVSDHESPVSIAYRKAKARLTLQMRQQDIELAEAGSPSATEAMRSHLLKMLQDE